MKKWVLQYPNKETGGDLFGLWSDEGDNAVIHVVLGPGRDCTHGDYPFYQDVNYLEKVGSLLTENYMLGHIGEWHSHHQLQLDKPSDGDCRTIEQNFPRGSRGFFLMIVNIVDPDQVLFSPYIFKERSRRFRAGYVEPIVVISPFSLLPDISQNLKVGREAYRKAAASIEGRKSTSNSSIPATSSKTSKVHKKVMPVILPDSRYQWYSKEENRAVVEDIYYGLKERVGEIEVTFDEKNMKKMNITFVYHDHEVCLIFPDMFPLCSAEIKVNKKLLCHIFLLKRFTIESFDLKEFLEVVFTRLTETQLNDFL